MSVFLDAAAVRAKALFFQALEIWAQGGWAMVAIAAIGLLMFGVGVRVALELRRKGPRSVSEDIWRDWISDASARRGSIGSLLDEVADRDSFASTAAAFEQLRVTESAPLKRDLRVMGICVSAAPLVGLLGTVTGMLSTFGAMATGSGGDKTMGLIAAGISEALITTETGLVIALSGLFCLFQLTRRFQAYEAFLAHLEVVCNQVLHKRLDRERQSKARSIAQQRIQRALSRNVLPTPAQLTN